jgi:hypothetical protein
MQTQGSPCNMLWYLRGKGGVNLVQPSQRL